jgi:putative restriction endonuclease
MKLFVGVTDFDWYAHLSAASDLEEVNFWSPGNAPFKVIEPGALFLFKLKAPYGHAIVGGGVFAHATSLPISLAWDTFGEKNGAASLEELRSRIARLHAGKGAVANTHAIGCRLVQQPFFFRSSDWFPMADDYPVNSVQGKSYDVESAEGQYLLGKVEERLPWKVVEPTIDHNASGFAERLFGRPILTLPRLGQGTFRVSVLDNYERRCAISGERTLPILDAAHIKPWAEGGQHAAGNGLLLRTDIHRLFDLGYVTVGHDHKFEVSPKLREDYENGRAYYDLHGRSIRPPKMSAFLPSREALDWHHTYKFARPGR